MINIVTITNMDVWIKQTYQVLTMTHLGYTLVFWIHYLSYFPTQHF